MSEVIPPAEEQGEHWWRRCGTTLRGVSFDAAVSLRGAFHLSCLCSRSGNALFAELTLSSEGRQGNWYFVYPADSKRLACLGVRGAAQSGSDAACAASL